MQKRIIDAILAASLTLTMAGCSAAPTSQSFAVKPNDSSSVLAISDTPLGENSKIDIFEKPIQTETTSTPKQTEEKLSQKEEISTQGESVPVQKRNYYCIAIDPGHQSKGNYNKEPIGPGASQQKAKVSSGTQGGFTGIQEYVLNLQVGLQLQTELETRGFQVVMTRTTHDVDISNAQRAQMAADAGADVLVRIHANGSEDPDKQGAMTICMTPENPYCPELYNDSRRLSDDILNCMTEATGSTKNAVWETDTMSGINWATVPVTIVEMGYMTNREEDYLMTDPAYQQKIVTGIADGLDRYFGTGLSTQYSTPKHEQETEDILTEENDD